MKARSVRYFKFKKYKIKVMRSRMKRIKRSYIVEQYPLTPNEAFISPEYWNTVENFENALGISKTKPTILGTGGDMEGGEDLSKVFYQPENYKLKDDLPGVEGKKFTFKIGKKETIDFEEEYKKMLNDVEMMKLEPEKYSIIDMIDRHRKYHDLIRNYFVHTLENNIP